MRIVPSQIVAYMEANGGILAPDNTGMGPGSYSRVNLSEVAAMMRMIDDVPSELITLRGADIVEFVVAREHIRTAVQKWRTETHSDHKLGNPPNKQDQPQPLKVIQNLLRKCPDDVVLAGVLGLSFLASDPDLQADLQTDLGGIEMDIAARKWKGVTVIGGATIEALLLWSVSTAEAKLPGTITAIVSATNPKKSTANEWDLAELIRAAEHIRLISKEDRDLLWSLKDFRNLIHPGRSARKKMQCGEDTAHFALGGIHLVVRRIQAQIGALL